MIYLGLRIILRLEIFDGYFLNYIDDEVEKRKKKEGSNKKDSYDINIEFCLRHLLPER